MLTLASLGSAGQRQTGRQSMHGSRLTVASRVVHTSVRADDLGCYNGCVLYADYGRCKSGCAHTHWAVQAA